jgi:hypothetical protein
MMTQIRQPQVFALSSSERSDGRASTIEQRHQPSAISHDAVVLLLSNLESKTIKANQAVWAAGGLELAESCGKNVYNKYRFRPFGS